MRGHIAELSHHDTSPGRRGRHGRHIAGGSYRVEAVWNHPVRPNPDDAAYQEVDLRVARLAGANLRHYVELYTDRTEVSLGRCAVIGGYGLGRGVELRKFGMTYGYAWEEGAVTQNLQLRWCTNSIDAISLNVRSTNPLNGTLSNHDFPWCPPMTRWRRSPRSWARQRRRLVCARG